MAMFGWLREARSFCLALESFEPILDASDLLRQHLDRHVPIEPLVMRPVHLTHPTSADLLDYAIVTEGATDEVSHCLGSREWYRTRLRGANRVPRVC